MDEKNEEINSAFLSKWIGREKRKVDDKGRCPFPARFRVAGKGIIFSEFAVTRGMGKCISVFPVAKFEEFIENFDPNTLSARSILNFFREFVSWTHIIPLDPQGRLNIPSILLEYAGIKDEVLILGVGEWIEIWDEEKYNAYLVESASDFEEGALEFYQSLIRGRKGINRDESKDASERS